MPFVPQPDSAGPALATKLRRTAGAPAPHGAAFAGTAPHGASGIPENGSLFAVLAPPAPPPQPVAEPEAADAGPFAALRQAPVLAAGAGFLGALSQPAEATGGWSAMLAPAAAPAPGPRDAGPFGDLQSAAPRRADQSASPAEPPRATLFDALRRPVPGGATPPLRDLLRRL